MSCEGVTSFKVTCHEWDLLRKFSVDSLRFWTGPPQNLHDLPKVCKVTVDSVLLKGKILIGHLDISTSFTMDI